MKKAIIFDRDGVINENKPYGVSNWKEFKFLPNVFKAFKLCDEFVKIVITNQSGIGRGYYTKEDVESIHKKMLEKFEKNNISIDKIYYCPHKPEDNCNCRKPEISLGKKAISKFDIDIEKSWMIGDKTSDIEFGRRLGLKTVLVKTGFGGSDNKYIIKPNITAKNILDAIKMIKMIKND